MRHVSILVALALTTACQVDDASTAPIVEIQPQEPVTSDDLVAVITHDAPDTHDASYTWAWELDGVVQPALTGDTVSADLTAKGQTWTVAVTAEGASAAGHTAVTIRNTPPVVDSLAFSIGAPTSSDDLVVVPSASDADDEPLQYKYTWTRDGESVAASGDTILSSLTAAGQVWEVSVVADDGFGESAARSLSVTIGNAPPVIDSLSFAPAEPTTSDDLVAVVSASDAEGQPIQLQYTWTRDGAPTSVTGDTVLSSLTAPNQVWRVSVIADDGLDQSAPSSLAVTINNLAPVIESVELTPSEPREKSTIQATVQASDADGDPITFNYRWLVNGAQVASSTKASLSGSSFSKGDLVSVEVTPNDGYQSGDTVTSSAVTVLNTPPTIDKAVLTNPIFKATNAACTALGWSDDDGDPESLQVRWQVNGASAGTSATLGGDAFNKGDAVQCFVTPHDGDEAGSELASAVVTVSNSRPTLASVDVVPESPRTSDTLSATLNGAADDDGDDVSFAYYWQVNGARVIAGATLGSKSFVKGDVVAVKVAPNDGENAGTTVTSPDVVVVNTPPGAPSLTLGPAYDLRDLQCVIDAESADDDDDDVTYAFSWTTGGVAYTGPVLTTDHSGDTIPASALHIGDEWACAATPSDGEDTGAQATADTVTVQISNDGSSSEAAAVTCYELILEHPSKPSDVYWIDPDDDGDTSNAYEAYCDMTSDGGGWTLMAWTGNSGAQPYGVPYPGHDHCPGLACQRGSGVPKGDVGALMARSTELGKAQSNSTLPSYVALEDYEHAGKFVYGDLTGLDAEYTYGNCTGTGGFTGTYTSIVGPTSWDGTTVYVAAGFRYSSYDMSVEPGNYIWNIGEPMGFCYGTGTQPGTWMGSWTSHNYGPHLQGSPGAHSVWAR